MFRTKLWQNEKNVAMADSVQWLSQSDYSICISILVEFYYNIIATYFNSDQIIPSPYIVLSTDTLEGNLGFIHISLSTIVFGIFQLYLLLNSYGGYLR